MRRFALLLLGSLLARLAGRLRPDRWLTPHLTLRLLRSHFGPSTAALGAGVRRWHPDGLMPVVEHDVPYRSSLPARDGLLDVVRPPGEGPFPVVLWVHGGGWYFGDKGDVTPYLERLTAAGYAAVAVNYPRTPEHRFPAQPLAILDALRFVQEQADQWALDPQRLVLGGDSAGGQLALAVALATASPEYAAALGAGWTPPPDTLRGVATFGPTWATGSFRSLPPIFAAVMCSAVWALTGHRTWTPTETDLLDLLGQLTPERAGGLPPVFLRAGAQDPFTPGNTVAFLDRANELGLTVDASVVADQAAAVGHQFQLALGTEPAQRALVDLVAFLQRIR